MTLIVGWIACDNKVDGKKPSAMYFGSDSRFTWGKSHEYNLGQKIILQKNILKCLHFVGMPRLQSLSCPH